MLTREELVAFEPIYEMLDLADYDARYAGQTLNVLRNPSRRFRRQFANATGQDWLLCVAVILGVESVEQVEILLDDMDAEIYRWLLVGVYEPGDGKPLVILPAVYRIWDRWAADRVKAHAAI